MSDTLDFYSLADESARAHGVDPSLVRGVMDTESGGLADRAGARSKAGAVGPMQLMPAAAEDMGVDRNDPAQNIDGGAKYLGQLRQRFGNDRDALMAYNWGPGNVLKWKQAGSDPDAVPAETQDYLDRVQGNRAKHASMSQESVSVPVAPSGGSGEAQEYTLTVDGVPFHVTSTGTRADAAKELQRTLTANPDILGSAAAKNGMKYDWKTGRASEYNVLEKIGIGYGKVANDVVTGLQEFGAMATGNAQELQRLKDQTDQERELYARLGTEGEFDATDVGELLIAAPLMFGPTGILRVAAGYGLFSGAQATGNEDTHLGNAVQGGAGALLGGGLFKSPFVAYRALQAVGAKTLAAAGSRLALDAVATGGLASAQGLGGKLFRVGQKILKQKQKAERVSGRGPNAYDRSGSAGPDMGADAGTDLSNGLIGHFLSDVGRELKDEVTGKMAEIANNVKYPGEKQAVIEALVSRMAANFTAESADEHDE